MIKMFCDVCGKQINKDFSSAINLEFNYKSSDFSIEIDNYKPKSNVLNLCVKCAESVLSDIEDLRKIAMQEEDCEAGTRLIFDRHLLCWMCEKCNGKMVLPGIAPDVKMLIQHEWKFCPHCGEQIDYTRTQNVI